MARVRGIDVSHWQGTIDWSKVARSGIEFAILKVSQGGNFKDTKFEEYYIGSLAAGIPVGAYIYNKVTSVEEAKREAEYAVTCLNGRALPLGVWLDMEDKSMRKLGAEKLSAIIDAEARILQQAGYKVNVYCNRDWYKNVLNGSFLSHFYKMWIARYPKGDNGVLKENLRESYMGIYQYSSKAKVNGINGYVDANIIYDDEIAGWIGVKQELPVNTQKASVSYQVMSGMKRYGMITNCNHKNGDGYAGVDGKAITKIAMKTNAGSIEYRVHILGKGWLSWVSGFDWNEHKNGYAGNGAKIDAIQIRTRGCGGKAKYRVSTIKSIGYAPWVTEGSDYAGNLGVAIDKVQIYIE